MGTRQVDLLHGRERMKLRTAAFIGFTGVGLCAAGIAGLIVWLTGKIYGEIGE